MTAAQRLRPRLRMDEVEGPGSGQARRTTTCTREGFTYSWREQGWKRHCYGTTGSRCSCGLQCLNVATATLAKQTAAEGTLVPKTPTITPSIKDCEMTASSHEHQPRSSSRPNYEDPAWDYGNPFSQRTVPAAAAPGLNPADAPTTPVFQAQPAR